MINREQILEYFRSDKMEELTYFDRCEIMLACCSQSEFLEIEIKRAIEKESNYTGNIYEP